MPQSKWTLQGRSQIQIQRDSAGIPHIHAKDLYDASFALGYCHAVDRSLPLVLTRIIAQGRCCELLKDTDMFFEVDRFFRKLHFTDQLKAELKKLSSL